jgi:hypothetical protein
MKSTITKIVLISTFSILLISFSCKKEVTYPIIPHIDLISFEKIADSSGIDQQGIIGLSFTDGDGDIGLTSTQNTGNYLYDLFIKYFEKKNGKFEEIILTTPNQVTGKPDTLTFNGRIPNLTPQGNNKAIKGEIYDTLYINNPASTYDTIRYEIYIEDRALHKSNVVTTPDIIINKKARKP